MSPARLNPKSKACRNPDWEFNAASANESLITVIDIGPAYLADLATKVDFAKIRAANIGIGYDALHGSGAGYLDRVLIDNGIPVTALHVDRDVYFGGHHPEPAEEQMAGLKAVMQKNGLRSVSRPTAMRIDSA